MQRDRHQLVRDVGTQTDDVECETEHQRGQDRDLVAMRKEQVMHRQPSSGEKVPLVTENAKEPNMASLYDVEDEANHDGNDERRRCDAIARPRPGGATSL